MRVRGSRAEYCYRISILGQAHATSICARSTVLGRTERSDGRAALAVLTQRLGRRSVRGTVIAVQYGRIIGHGNSPARHSTFITWMFDHEMNATRKAQRIVAHATTIGSAGGIVRTRIIF